MRWPTDPVASGRPTLLDRLASAPDPVAAAAQRLAKADEVAGSRPPGEWTARESWATWSAWS